MIVHLSKEFRFEASHQLPNHDGKCARLHGHSWVLLVGVVGVVNTVKGFAKEGMVRDYADIKGPMQPLIDQLDHHHLNDLLGDYPPTSENVLIWIASHLEEMDFDWEFLILEETCTSKATLIREENLSGF